MKFVVVEDDENKRMQVVSFVRECYPDSIIVEARSFHSGICCIVNETPDFVILDMSMPTFDVSPDESGGRPQAYAGREILSRMDKHGLEVGVVVLTQFDRFGEGVDALTLDQLDNQLSASFSGNYLGAVYYNVTEDGWKECLQRTICGALGSEVLK